MRLSLMVSDFRHSARAFRNVRSLCFISLLTALQIILGALTIQIGQSIQITFDYLPLSAVALFFGPVPAMLSGALADLLSFLIRPTGAFNPGFTISAALGGLIYSLFFYNRSFSRPWMLPLYAALSRLLVVAVCNICLNSLWLLWMYGEGAWAWIPGRVIKNIIEYPVSVILMIAIQDVLRRVGRILRITPTYLR